MEGKRKEGKFIHPVIYKYSIWWGMGVGGEKCTQTLPSFSVGLFTVVVVLVKQFRNYFRDVS